MNSSRLPRATVSYVPPTARTRAGFRWLLRIEDISAWGENYLVKYANVSGCYCNCFRVCCDVCLATPPPVLLLWRRDTYESNAHNSHASRCDEPVYALLTGLWQNQYSSDAPLCSPVHMLHVCDSSKLSTSQLCFLSCMTLITLLFTEPNGADFILIPPAEPENVSVGPVHCAVAHGCQVTFYKRHQVK